MSSNVRNILEAGNITVKLNQWYLRALQVVHSSYYIRGPFMMEFVTKTKALTLESVKWNQIDLYGSALFHFMLYRVTVLSKHLHYLI